MWLELSSSRGNSGKEDVAGLQAETGRKKTTSSLVEDRDLADIHALYYQGSQALP